MAGKRSKDGDDEYASSAGTEIDDYGRLCGGRGRADSGRYGTGAGSVDSHGWPGRRTLTQDLVYQPRAFTREMPREALQLVRAPAPLAAPANSPAASPHEVAAAGVSGPASPFPHAGAIGASYGQAITAQAHFGAEPKAACDALGAEAFTVGDHVAFASDSPSLELAGHEAAHTLQQAQGVQLKGGVGQVGDEYEQAADHAASLAARGDSAAHLFATTGTAAGGPASGAVQRMPAGGAAATSASAAAVPAPGQGVDVSGADRWGVSEIYAQLEEAKGRALGVPPQIEPARTIVAALVRRFVALRGNQDENFEKLFASGAVS